MKRLAIVMPPSEMLADDRVFIYIGPVQIATVARDVGRWDVQVVDLTGHALRCEAAKRRERTDDGGAESGRGALRGAVSEQRFEYHAGPACLVETWENAEREIAALCDPDVVGVYALSCQVHAAVKILGLVRRHHPRAKTILGGPHVAMAPEAASTLGFDHVVADLGGGGGGEAPLLRLLARIGRGLDAPSIVRAVPNDVALHHWPWAARALVDVESYRYLLNGERAATVVTQRGCSFICSFCSHTEFYRRVDFRDPSHVEAELDELRSRFGYRAVMAYDDETNLNRRHFEALCDVFKRGGWLWRGFIKSNLFDEDQARLAAESGAVQLCTGVESADDAMKRHIAKKSTVDDDTRFVRLCLEHGIAPKCFSIVGLAGESAETAAKLEAWLLARIEEGLVDFDVTINTPYPGTRPFDDLMATGLHVATPEHGLRLVKRPDFVGSTVHYKTRPGDYVALIETFDPRTGETLLSAAQLVAWRERIDQTCRDAVAKRGARRATSNREEG